MGERRTKVGACKVRSALTLVELLVVIAIMSILLSILLTTLSKVRGAARSVLCKNKLQGVAQSFQLFASDYGYADRGRESEELGSHRFRLEDFQDSLYGTEEFFNLGDLEIGDGMFDARKQPLICPDGPRGLSRDIRLGWGEAADVIMPLESVSIGFNMRLYQASGKIVYGPLELDTLLDVTLSPQVLEHPWTPLAFDIDGASARLRAQPLLPFYSAPPVEPDGMYASGKYWFPAARHAGQVHAAFIGGHVWSASDPKIAPGWKWSYQPPPDE